uniref:Uncharacterized protein n=1 Tax=Daphnia galeata TaxID=27404 RepID=A0A8J2WHV7_9CRUS|nr:unnamed protein product [Daphnia galeata]
MGMEQFTPYCEEISSTGTIKSSVENMVNSMIVKYMLPQWKQKDIKTLFSGKQSGSTHYPYYPAVRSQLSGCTMRCPTQFVTETLATNDADARKAPSSVRKQDPALLYSVPSYSTELIINHIGFIPSLPQSQVSTPSLKHPQTNESMEP